MIRPLRSLRALLARHAPEALKYHWRKAAELAYFNRTPIVHDLPPIFHYWSNSYVRPRFEAIGFSSPEDFFFQRIARLSADRPDFALLSLGSGRCETELTLARRLRQAGVSGFKLVCTDINPQMLAAAAEASEHAGLSKHFEFKTADVNHLRPLGRFDAVMANQCLHHFVELERVFDGIRDVLDEDGALLISDVIGRNGHQMWPEALQPLNAFWAELPERLRIDPATGRPLPQYDNRDYSSDCFEGIRAQDILPLLIERFRFSVFAPYACITIPFVDRRFGHNYRADDPEDRARIDRIAQFDEQLLAQGTIKPTQLVAELRKSATAEYSSTTTLNPADCVRWPEA